MPRPMIIMIEKDKNVSYADEALAGISGKEMPEDMTLRDYFAGQAMIGFIVASEQNGEDTAFCAYAFADSMMEARK